MEATKNILDACSSGCKMAIDSMKQVRGDVQNDRFGKMIDESIEKHQQFEKECSKLTGQYGLEEKEPSKMAEMMSWFTTEMRLMKEDDDKQIAKLMMNGCNMGIQTLIKKVHENSNAEKDSIDLAKKIIAEEERFVEDVKQYL